MGSNLYKETLDVLHKNGKTKEDIIRIGNEDYEMDFETFTKLADKTYNNETMTYRVAYDFMIIFYDGSWMERMHDGHWEFWRFNKIPKIKKKSRKIKQLFGIDQSIEQLYNLGGK